MLFSKRVVLVSGKGGVGRTVCAAALARAAATRGRRVLVADLEEASSERRSALARLYGRDQLPKEPMALSPNVEGVLVQTEYGAELFLRSIFRTKSLVGLAMRSRSLQRLLYAAPSFREMGMFFHLLHLLEREEHGRPLYDFVIADLPATGHALAMTSLPEILLRLMPSGPVAAAFHRGQALLNDPAITASWIVTLPESLPVSETLELLEGFRRTKMPLGGILVNRMPANPFSLEEREALANALGNRQVRGLRGLHRIAQSESALERLQRETDLPISVLPEFDVQGEELVEELSRKLLEGQS
jgi:arsenite/tail-anchored protein-transporting ATPase